MKKYEKARKLQVIAHTLCLHGSQARFLPQQYIDKIRKNYDAELTGGTTLEKQRATAVYLIDKLALRVGYASSSRVLSSHAGLLTC